jgi:glycosyltransferase involved in cell wall biosynthesis
MTAPRLAYLVSQHPALSHAFIDREIAALRARGADITTFSVRRPGPTDLLGADKQQAAATTTVLRDRRWGVWARAHVSLLVRHPWAYVTTLAGALRSGPPGPRAHVWQGFYWLQAVVLLHHLRSRGLRHVHVHFANNGADIARRAAVIARATGGTLTWSLTVHGPLEFLDPVGLDVPAKATDASFVSCITDWCRRGLQALAPDASTILVHMGADLDRFPAVAREHPAGSLRVLFVGRLVPEKGVADLIDAARSLRDVDLVIAGAGPLRDRLERRAAGTARFVGGLAQSELVRWYDWADVLCLPSYHEGLPVVLMEALATGLPVVTTAVAGIPELVTDDETGLVVEPGDIEGIAAALEKLRDPTLRERLGAAGRRRVVSDFDASTAVAPLWDAFAKISP